MKVLYLSQPLNLDKLQEVRKVRKLILQHLAEKKLILDQNHEYHFAREYAWPSIDRSIIHSETAYFKKSIEEISYRVQSMKDADYIIFIDQWMDFIECKIDRFIIEQYMMPNIIVFRVKDDELKLTEWRDYYGD